MRCSRRRRLPSGDGGRSASPIALAAAIGPGVTIASPSSAARTFSSPSVDAADCLRYLAGCCVQRAAILGARSRAWKQWSAAEANRPCFFARRGCGAVCGLAAARAVDARAVVACGSCNSYGAVPPLHAPLVSRRRSAPSRPTNPRAIADEPDAIDVRERAQPAVVVEVLARGSVTHGASVITEARQASGSAELLFAASSLREDRFELQHDPI